MDLTDININGNCAPILKVLSAWHIRAFWVNYFFAKRAITFEIHFETNDLFFHSQIKTARDKL